MKAMLLAAGKGARMYPLTLEMPKAAIPVLGRPLAVQILHRMAQAGVDEAVINLHHRPGKLREVLTDGAGSGLPALHFSHEETILGTAGGLRKAAPLLRGDGPILVHNSDSLADIDLLAALRAHRESDHLATLVLAPVRPGYSSVDVDAEGRVLSLAGGPSVEPGRIAASYLFTGCHILDESLLARIPAEGASDIVLHVYRDLAAEGRLGFFVHQGFWWEFGSPELYLEGSLKLLGLAPGERNGVACHDPVHTLDSATIAIGAGATMGPGTRVHGRAALGFASGVDRDGYLEDAIVMPETWIGPRCRLKRAIIAPGLELPADFQAEQAMVCRDPDPDRSLVPPMQRRDDLLIRSFDLRAV